MALLLGLAGDGIFDVLNDALLETLDAGLIDRDGYEAFYHPVYFRTLDELTAPMVDDKSPCRKFFALDRAETYEVPVPFVEEFQRTGDVEQFARDYTSFFRVVTEAGVRLTFAGHPDLDALVDDIYGRTERLIRDDPERYEFHYVALAALLTRRD